MYCNVLFNIECFFCLFFTVLGNLLFCKAFFSSFPLCIYQLAYCTNSEYSFSSTSCSSCSVCVLWPLSKPHKSTSLTKTWAMPTSVYTALQSQTTNTPTKGKSFLIELWLILYQFSHSENVSIAKPNPFVIEWTWFGSKLNFDKMYGYCALLKTDTIV